MSIYKIFYFILESVKGEKCKLIYNIMKTLKITEKLHKDIKVFCAKRDLKINEWVENELKKSLNNYDIDRESGDKIK